MGDVETASMGSSDRKRAYDASNHDEHEPLEVTRVKTSGGNGEYVHLGGKTYLRSELMYAFGGTFTPGVTAQPKIKLGNASPMGLFAFATTTLILNLINARARGVKNNAVMLGCGLFYGGVVQIIAGIWELILENTFGATVFTAYGGFWMAFAVITMNGFNIVSSYGDDVKELNNALGLFMVAWALVTFFFVLCTLRSTVPMFGMLFLLMVLFILLAGEKFSTANGSVKAADHLSIAAGVIGCVVAMFAYYNAMAGLLTKENSWIDIHAIYMPGAITPNTKAKEA